MKSFPTPMLAGQTDGELWLVASYPIEPLLGGGRLPDEWGSAVRAIPFVEVYTYGGGECCVVDVFADAKALKNPRRQEYGDNEAGYMKETVVRMSAAVAAAWGRAPRRHTEYMRSKPLSHFMHPEVGPLTLYRFQIADLEDVPFSMRYGKAAPRRPGWVPHAVAWLREAVVHLLNSRGHPVGRHAELTNEGEFTYAEVAQYFIDKGERGYER